VLTFVFKCSLSIGTLLIGYSDIIFHVPSIYLLAFMPFIFE